jgi:hypothetical protein
MDTLLPGAILEAREPDEGDESAWNTVRVVGVNAAAVNGPEICFTPAGEFGPVEGLSVTDLLRLYAVVSQGEVPAKFETPVEDLIHARF